MRDEYRQEYDAGRGGWGHNRLREEAERQERERRLAREAVYAEAPGDGPRDIPAGAEGAYAEREGAERAGEGVVEKRVAEDHGAKRARGQSEDAVESNKVSLSHRRKDAPLPPINASYSNNLWLHISSPEYFNLAPSCLLLLPLAPQNPRFRDDRSDSDDD